MGFEKKKSIDAVKKARENLDSENMDKETLEKELFKQAIILLSK
jgi:hypothetical protein